MPKKKQKSNSPEIPPAESRQRGFSRKEFLKLGATGLGGASFLWASPLSLHYLSNSADIDNPLGFYPNRD